MKVRCTASALTIRSLPVVGLGTDTGKRMVLNQRAQVYAWTDDEVWAYVDAPAGRGWCHGGYLAEVADFEPSPAWPKVPNGLSEIMRIFGSPGSAVASAGRAQLPEPLRLGWQNTYVSKFACHKLLEDPMTSVFATIHSRGLWSLLKTFDGCYNDRTVTRSQKISTHAWGIGVDLNASENRLGAVPKMDRRIVGIFQDHGFKWGGEWSRPDGMHFQWATSY